jgi:hypothetical protein
LSIQCFFMGLTWRSSRTRKSARHLTSALGVTWISNMRMLLSISTLLLLGCAMQPQDFQPVWMQPGAPPVDLPSPAGFTVSPLQAYTAVWDSRSQSIKHVWHIYADSQYYYVHDIFLSDSPRKVFLLGVRVDGQTGEIVKR